MLSLARQGYAAQQVESVLRANTGIVGSRFELLDHNFNVVTDMTVAKPGVQSAAYAPGTITAASVEVDTSRKIVGSLDLTLLADERLRDVPYQYKIKAYIKVGPMPDGKFVEFECGVFPWQLPERNTAPGLEEWTISLGDNFWSLDIAGPGPTGFQVAKREKQSDALKRLAALGGLADGSLISDTGAIFQGPRSWGLTRPLQGWGFMYVPSWDEGWGFFRNTGEPQYISVGGANPDSTRTTTLLDIYTEIAKGIGNNLFMKADGRPVAIPAVDWTKAAPVVVFGSGPDSITISPVAETSDTARFCNRVFCWNESGGSAVFYVTLDANDVVPGHPLSQAKIRAYADKFIPNTTADSQVAAEQNARKELLDGLAQHQKVEFDTLFWPVEPYDIVGMLIQTDPTYSTLANFQLTKYNIDLMTGVMHHEANRVYPVVT